ncbi:hypothetical protein L6164_036503 [Bauhinia variegata]|uniref:Uncharacterized protein n=1 Tax=Bauhinia variegata TaxID=167791 RepID=A0ACB9KHC8_BAUVA|nr:hypothetical protein L6164_036503 [Bauhinia variegata]
MTHNNPIRDGDILVSAKAIFALGFFSHANSNNRYVEIWYNKVSEQTIVWVANRESPLTNTSGILSIDIHGNLIILDTQTPNPKPIWSANVSFPAFSSNTSAVLLDTGNFILVQNESQKVLWQSFDYPCNTYLPFMKLGLDRKTGINRFLTSWKSPNDPGTGNLTYKFDAAGIPQLFFYKNGAPVWRAGFGQILGFLKNGGPRCGISDKFECQCLPGFQPKNPKEWCLGDGSGGCIRKRNVSTCQSGEGFVIVASVKSPDTSKARVDASLSLEACNEKCLKDCSCAAYTSADGRTGSGCLTWHRDMLDTRTFAHVGQDLYVRVDAHELASYAKKPHGSLGKKGIIAIIVVSAFLVLLLMVYIVHWIVKKQKQARRKHSKYPSIVDLQDTRSIKDLESRQNLDLPFFDLSDIAEATNNFSPDNKLGQGGFGSVYKVIFRV